MIPGISTIAGAAELAATWPAWAAFNRSLRNPERAQTLALHRSLENGGAAFMQAQGLTLREDADSFRSKVPPMSWEDLEPWIQRVAEGEPSVLSRQPVVCFERTTGSTGANKLVPMTAGYLSELQAAVYPWMHDLMGQHRLLGTTSYWSISAGARPMELSPGGIPIGVDSDASFFGGLAGWGITTRMAVPPDVGQLPTMDACRYATALHLLKAPNLGFISVWSPSFLTLLMEAIEAHWDALLADLPPPRARALSQCGLDPAAIWPRLRVISCWTSSAAGRLIPALRRWFPTVPIQGKGLLATEGVVSIPWRDGPGAVLAVGSHFLEFLDDRGTSHLAHELSDGGEYETAMTTGSGLWRYRLGDRIRVVGWEAETPRVEFIGRSDGRSDLCGEKLSPGRVERVLSDLPGFAMLAPEADADPPYYALIVEQRPDADTLADAVERRLREGHHYDHCRALGQLGPVRAVPVPGAAARYEARLVSLGLRAGDIKPTPLSTRSGWTDWLHDPEPATSTV